MLLIVSVFMSFVNSTTWPVILVHMDIADIVTRIIVVLGTILISMTLHEAMHGYMAYFLGDDTAKLQGRLTLNPLKHIDPVLTIALPLFLAVVGGPIFGGAKPVPYNPNRVRYGEWGAALVAIVGPLTNLILAFILFGCFVLAGASGLIGSILSTAVLVNLGFFVFNILPIPPLDGSRVIYALAPEFVRRGMELIERYGLILIFLLIFLGGSLVSGYMSGAIQYFLTLFTYAFSGV